MSPAEVDAAAGQLLEVLGQKPRVHLILGSGLSGLAETIEQPRSVSFDELPGHPVPAVAGHAGRYVGGVIEGVQVLAQAGRVHFYEGASSAEVAAPVRIGHRLGAEVLIVTNAAGAIDRRFAPGSIMLIDDHINLQWRVPLAGPVFEPEERFPDMSEPYDRQLQALAEDTAHELGIPLARGVYAAVLGPSYETPAEVRMLEHLGADAVGMSTVPEVIVAKARGLRVAGFSLITNLAAGRGSGGLSHDEVIEVGLEAGRTLQTLIEGVVGRIGAN